MGLVENSLAYTWYDSLRGAAERNVIGYLCQGGGSSVKCTVPEESVQVYTPSGVAVGVME